MLTLTLFDPILMAVTSYIAMTVTSHDRLCEIYNSASKTHDDDSYDIICHCEHYGMVEFPLRLINL